LAGFEILPILEKQPALLTWSLWPDRGQLQERGTPPGTLSAQVSNRDGSLVMSVSLGPFQVRVFTT
jgi:hypothetical protein